MSFYASACVFGPFSVYEVDLYLWVRCVDNHASCLDGQFLPCGVYEYWDLYMLINILRFSHILVILKAATWRFTVNYS